MPGDSSRLYSGNYAFVIDVLIVLLVTFFSYSLGGGGIAGWAGATTAFFISGIVVLALSLRILNEWDRSAVLRLGKFAGIIGPGLFLIIPIVETTPVTIDTRVIGTPFKAERTLTKDNVPVDVDAILFWQVRDPQKAVLNVQTYYDSVLLASQTAMRDIIGKSALADMLAGRDVIGEDIQKLIEDRIASWGIEATSVEIRDVTIPNELQNAMARVATSDREKQARVILAESESLAADKMLEAAQKYEKDPYAMQLRALNMMYEISINGKNVIVFIPTESRGFSMPMPFGVMGLKDSAQQQQKGKGSKASGSSSLDFTLDDALAQQKGKRSKASGSGSQS